MLPTPAVRHTTLKQVLAILWCPKSRAPVLAFTMRNRPSLRTDNHTLSEKQDFFSNFPDCSEYKSFKNDFYHILNRSIFTLLGLFSKGSLALNAVLPLALHSCVPGVRCLLRPSVTLHCCIQLFCLLSPQQRAPGSFTSILLTSGLIYFAQTGTLRASQQSARFCEAPGCLQTRGLLKLQPSAEWGLTINSVSEAIALTCIAVESIPFSHANDSSHDIHPSYWMAVVNIYT